MTMLRLLIPFVIIHLATSYIVEPGPLVKATKGEVWPKPQKQQWGDGYLVLRPSVFKFQVITENCDILQEALVRYWRIIVDSTSLGRRGRRPSKNTPRKYKTWKNDPSFVGNIDSLDIILTNPCGTYDMPNLDMDERYTLSINTPQQKHGLESTSVWGILRGLETFSQLLYLADDGVGLMINTTYIEDYPRFSHRGLLLDTSRHFLPMFSILQTLDGMSYNKMNVFHWHIVDDQSFPYQSKAFPKLSEKGAYHPEYMIYTPEDVQKVIAHARDLGIRVMVEFDTPGHTRSWGEGQPKLLTTCYDKNNEPNGYYGPIDPTRITTYDFLNKFFQEVVEIFPEKYIHLGGDEVDFDCWESNPSIKKFMSQHNITTYSELEEFYIQKLVDIVEDLKVKSIVWEEVFVNGVQLPNNTVVHVWKGNTDKEVLNNITKTGLRALYSSCWYLDSISGGGDWQKYYKCDPHLFPGTNIQKKLVIGGEACMWGEVVDGTNIATRVWPRACAAAEKLWSDRAVNNISDAAKRIEEHACRMQIRGIPAQPPNGPGFCL